MHKKKFVTEKKIVTSFENSQYMFDFLGFWIMVILNLYGIPFHAVVVLGPEHDFLFKSTSTYCGTVCIINGLYFLEKRWYKFSPAKKS